MVDDEKTLQQRFEEFDKTNPSIYKEFRRISYEIGTVRKHYGAKAIFEIIRYHRVLSGKSEEEEEQYKINNSYISFYARKLIAENDHFANFFEIRKLKSERACPSYSSLQDDISSSSPNVAHHILPENDS